MHKIKPTPCRKCGGETTIKWDEGEKTSGMDIQPLRPAGMRKTCITCGFVEIVDDLENRENASYQIK